VLGNYGSEVTAVLANSQGGLELLPNKAYGNGWLEIRQNGQLLKSLPEQGDPYREIYQVRNKWFRLLREEWINPAGHDECDFDAASTLLDGAKQFHELINSTYHGLSYAHYGCDNARPSWEKVVWNLDPKYKGKDWEKLRIFSDEKKGKFRLFESTTDAPGSEDNSKHRENSSGLNSTSKYSSFGVELGDNAGSGDQTVPMRSADQQLLSGKFSGIFRQSGYEHQKSYSNDAAIHSTMFSLLKIIATMKWSGDA
jgi:hypothetical protein